jgi:hypothetical protein
MMFTIEMDADGGTASVITSLDLSGEHSDVVMYVYDDAVYIKQYDDEWELEQIVIVSHQQLADLMAAIGMTEGVYVRSKGDDR